MRKYAGIGARVTPVPVLRTMTEFARKAADAGWLLRSGAGRGADRAFEKGCVEASGARQIFLPWPNFDGMDSPYRNPTAEAHGVAAQFHNSWATCTHGARNLFARNAHIILGPNLDDPVDFVVCWSEGGRARGGTGHSMRIAWHHRIPVIDLSTDADLLEPIFVQRLTTKESVPSA